MLIPLLIVCLVSLVDSKAPVVPTPQHLEWAKMEIGAMISFGMETSGSNVSDAGFCTFNTGDWLPQSTWFDPLYIDTDQWARAMAAFGAKYAVFTAKHCTGFALWPTKVPGYNYNIKNTTWANGSGDLVSSFVKSCIRHNIKPGLYYGIGTNYYLNILNGEVFNTTNLVPGQRKVTVDEYANIVVTQLKELWTEYGPLAEVWFDGGTYSFTQQISALLVKTQNQTIAFQGPADFPNNVRWSGNEAADPAYPFWSTTDGTIQGAPFELGGVTWAPGESDTTIRNEGKWFWTDDYYTVGVKSLGELMKEYESSVGRNTNFLLNLSPDPYGVIPVADMVAYEQLGAAITKCYSKPINQTSSNGKNETQLKLDLRQPTRVNRIVIAEDQVRGQLVRNYTVSFALQDTPASYRRLANGTSIGNKRIEVLAEDIQARYLLLEYKGAAGPTFPLISKFAAHYCDRLY